MQITIHPTTLVNGQCEAPASKSYLQRAIALGVLSEDTTVITGYLGSRDADAAIGIAKELGANVEIKGDTVIMKGGFDLHKNYTLHCGEAGLSARMFGAIAALNQETVTLSGEGSLLQRPLHMVAQALEQFGKQVTSNNGYLPMVLSGKMKPSEITMDGSESSQLLTGLLMALPMLDGKSTLHVRNLKSIPYVQMTLDILAHFGISIEHEHFETFRISGPQKITAKQYQVEGDWSGAAFLLVAGAIAGDIVVSNLNLYSSQADKAILTALKHCGAEVQLGESSVRVTKSKLNAFEFDATHCPDLFPPLAALAACCDGQSTITGTQRLLNKESNRALSIQQELGKVGIEVILQDNQMLITGGKIQGTDVSSHNDHRIAMMMAVLGLVADSPMTITDAEAVQKSFPHFFETLERLTNPK